MAEFLSQLNDIQRSAVLNYNGASLIIAGAGSGKTRVMTYRIAHMISSGVEPATILALTFTNKASREMRERIKAIVPVTASRSIMMGTFHSVFSRILRAEAEVLGFPQAFVIYETSDSVNLVKSIIKELNLSDEKYKAKEVFSRISLSKNNLITPQMYQQDSVMMTEDRQRGWSEFYNVYQKYMARCKQNGAMDFDDLLLYTNILFHNHKTVLEKYQQQFKYILVDEYQDTNSAQYLVVKRISGLYKNICVVGDDAQSIYSFRGAKIENILRFQKDYPEAQVYKLEQNYRSTQNIVNAANSVISRNSKQLKKRVFSAGEVGEDIALRRAFTDKEESSIIVKDIIEYAHKDSLQWKDFAILYRTNAQSRSLEDMLRTKNVPYRIYGGISFYQRAEIKKMVAYVRLIVNTKDDEALLRVINFPARGIGDTSQQKIEAAAREHNISMWEVLQRFSPEELGIKGAATKKLGVFTSLILQMQALLEQKDAAELVAELAFASGVLNFFKDNPLPEAQSAYENIEELINMLKQQNAELISAGSPPLMLDEWMQNITLLTDMDNESDDDRNKVTLMTIHSAKGLEFRNVYIAGVEEGLFPSPRSAESLENLEEERRLFYVAITRAISRLMISFSLNRYRHGTSTPAMASRFIKEIDEKYLDKPELLSASRISDDEDDNSRPAWGNRGVFERKPAFSSPSSSPSSYSSESKYNNKPSYSAPKPLGNLRPAGVTMKNDETQTVNQVENLSVGSKVQHERFGKGEILTIERTQSDYKVQVDFGASGTKTLLLKFAKLKVL